MRTRRYRESWGHSVHWATVQCSCLLRCPGCHLMPLLSYSFNVNWLSTYCVPDKMLEIKRNLEWSLQRSTGFLLGLVMVIVVVEEEKAKTGRHDYSLLCLPSVLVSSCFAVPVSGTMATILRHLFSLTQSVVLGFSRETTSKTYIYRWRDRWQIDRAGISSHGYRGKEVLPSVRKVCGMIQALIWVQRPGTQGEREVWGQGALMSEDRRRWMYQPNDREQTAFFLFFFALSGPTANGILQWPLHCPLTKALDASKMLQQRDGCLARLCNGIKITNNWRVKCPDFL